MAGTLPPGLGNDAQATQATAFIRQQPWYLQWLQSQGITPGPDQQVKLSDTQRAQLMDLAMQHGIGFNDKYDMIDENGQIAEEHHKLKKIAIAAAIAGAGLTGLGAAGIGPLAGALGGGATAAATTTAGSVLPSTAIGSGFAPAIAGGSGLAALAPTAASVTTALSTGAKLASLASSIGKVGNALDPSNVGGPNSTSPRGSAYAAEANQLANNRAVGAKIDQAGPAADAIALKNQLRAALIAKMDPSAAALSLNGRALPSLVNADTIASAAKLRDSLAARVNAGRPGTTFGVPDPTQEELDAQAQAADAAGVGSGLNSKLASVGDALQTGSKLASLGKTGYDVGKQIWSMF